MRFLDHGSVQEYSAYSRNKELPLTGALLVLNNNKKNSQSFPYNFCHCDKKKRSIFYSTLVLKLLKNTHHYSVCFDKMLAESFPVLLHKLCVKQREKQTNIGLHLFLLIRSILWQTAWKTEKRLALSGSLKPLSHMSKNISEALTFLLPSVTVFSMEVSMAKLYFFLERQEV